MKMQIEGIPKEDRIAFKKQILEAIDNKGNVYFTLDKAIIEITQPYIATEESIIAISQHKKNINTVIHDFRVYQFNK